MNLSAKIDLENRIFARAAKLASPVDGVRGALISPNKDICLQALLAIYNRFFAAGNRALLAEKPFLTWQNFKRQQRFLPFLFPIRGVPFFACDFKANLFCSQNKFDK